MKDFSRRSFLKKTAVAVSATMVPGLALPSVIGQKQEAGITLNKQTVGPGANSYWTKEKIESFNQKYGIYDKGHHYHYPRQSFLKYGYYPPGNYVSYGSLL